MTDADLIYNALLRAERRLEEALKEPGPDGAWEIRSGAFLAFRVLREEIGNGIARERPQ
jgi:hypothetical protein